MTPENELPPQDNLSTSLFLPAGSKFDKPNRIVTLGHYYPESHKEAAKTVVQEARETYQTNPDIDLRAMRENLGWTQLINAVNDDRQWPLKRLFEILDPIL